jgi:hypothetical protein
MEDQIYFTDYKVSTITCNADLGIYVNLDILYEKIINNKLLVISEPQISVNEKFKVCFCTDPENNYIELVEIL